MSPRAKLCCGGACPTVVLSAVNKCSLARLEHFAKFQQRKGKCFGDRKRQIKHAVGKKTKREKEGEEEKREGHERSDPVSGSDEPNEDKKSDKNTGESPRKTKDKGKGKANYVDNKGGASLGTDQQTPGA